mgnify:CR=1 FL=1
MADYVKFTQKLSVVQESDAAEEIVLKGNGHAKKHLVGRDTNLCTWILKEKTASRRHAVIAVRQDKRCVTIRDNNSSFGVYLNKQRLPPGKTVNVKKRDVISFGKSSQSWVLSEMHFLSDAELVGIDEAGMRAYLHVLGLRETRAIARPDDFVPLSLLLNAHGSGALSSFLYDATTFVNAVGITSVY